MSKPHTHLLLPINQWTSPDYCWCLQRSEAHRPQRLRVTDSLLLTSCPRCLALYQAARTDVLHPLRVFSEIDTLRQAVTLNSPAAVARYCRHLVQERQEVTLCLMATSRYRLMHAEEVFRGTMELSLTHPREIFKAVLRHCAACFVLVHNHPSGEPEPSAQELERARNILKCSRLVQIPYIDHVIVARQGFYSLREHTALWHRTEMEFH